MEARDIQELNMIIERDKKIFYDLREVNFDVMINTCFDEKD